MEGRLDVYGEHEEGLQRWMRRFGPLTRQVAASQSLPEVCKAAMAVAQECMAAQVAAAAATVRSHAYRSAWNAPCKSGVLKLELHSRPAC